jgi:inosine-uridine nucleoside N-ribohydrolase
MGRQDTGNPGPRDAPVQLRECSCGGLPVTGTGLNFLPLEGRTMTPCKIILDSDIDTDCDDAGALAVLHNFANRKEAEILGIICSIPVPACVACVQAINEWYKRPDLPVGMLSRGIWEKKPSFAGYLAHREFLKGKGMIYNEKVGGSMASNSTTETADAVQLYRKLLAEQPSNDVTICAIGTLTALAALLCSGPDEISPLTGRELIEEKVRLLVSMAVATYPEGKDGFNWAMDLPSAALVIKDWPTPVAVQPSGDQVLTGRRLLAEASSNNPVREAYRIWFGTEHQERPSWDQLTVLYAVKGADSLFSEKSALSLDIDSTSGMHKWTPSIKKPQRIYLQPIVQNHMLASIIEELMLS